MDEQNEDPKSLRGKRIMKIGVLLFWSLIISIAGVRVTFSFIQNKPDVGICLRQSVSGVGTAFANPVIKDTGQILVINVQEMTLNSENSHVCATGILIRLKTKAYPRFSLGDQVNFSGNLSSPFNFSSTDGRIFDYKGYLAKDDIFYEIKSGIVSLTKANSTQNNWLQNILSYTTGRLYSIKHTFISNLNKVLGEPQASFATGLVVGERSTIDPKLLDDFRTVGLIHIIIFAGFHVAIVVASLRRMFSFLPRIWSILFVGIGLILFAVLVGGSATVIRSCSMASIALVADLFRRGYSSVRALIFVVLLMVIQSPMILFHDSAFQLSCLATLGMILLMNPLKKRLRFITDRFGIRSIVAATLAAQIFVSPLIIYLMGQVSVISIVVNILVLPFIPLTMLFVFLTGATGFVSGAVSTVMSWGSHLLLSYVLFIIQEFARIPFASFHIPSFSGWIVVAFYTIFLAVYWYIIKKPSVG